MPPKAATLNIKEDLDHGTTDTQRTCVPNLRVVTKSKDLPELIEEIKTLVKVRSDLHKEEKSLTLRIKQIERRTKKSMGEIDPKMTCMLATLVFGDLRQPIRDERHKIEKRITELAKKLPVAEWIESTKGLGLLGLGLIIGETGNLSNYANPAKVWKRLGLAVIGGRAQGKRTNINEVVEHGYSPRRRAVMFTIGDSMVKSRGAYRRVYDDRKEYEERNTQAGLHADFVKKYYNQEKYKEPNKTRIKEGKLPVASVAKRAQRYMEKRIVRDLWRQWKLSVQA